MPLKDLNDKIKIGYTQGWDNPIEDFLLPSLSESTKFRVISGYFSSYLLIPLFNGVKKFIFNNKGVINLIAGVIFHRDLKIINSTIKELDEILEDKLSPEFLDKEIIDPKLNEHLKLLAWLLKHNKLIVKLAIPLDEEGKTIPIGKKKAIEHEKIGIFSDDSNDYITFSGSTNATFAGWALQRDEFKVFKSWDYMKEYAALDLRKFETYWNRNDQTLKIIDFPNKLIKQIIGKHGVDSPEEIDFNEIDDVAEREIQESLIHKLSKRLANESDWRFREGCIIPIIDTLIPYDFQELALDHLKKTDYQCFMNMATGSGKTYVAIFAVYRLFQHLIKEDKQLLIIIGVPDSYLVKQWGTIIRKLSNLIIQCSSDKENIGWKDRTSNAFQMLNAGTIDHFFFVGTYNSLNYRFWEENLYNFENESRSIIFIADEAHSLGAPTGRLLLSLINPKYRIGLSATPYRYFDNEGTKFLLNWFLGQNDMFSYSLKKAQDGNKILKFEYLVRFCHLNDSNFEEFIKISKKLARMPDNTEEKAKKKKNKFFERANLLKKCPNKLPIVREILKELHLKNELFRAVIYCEDNVHVQSVESIIIDLNEEFDRINLKLESLTGVRKKKIIYQTISGGDENTLRVKKINKLKNKDLNLLIAMKCLDQGVDIPCLTIAIFVASSGSELEHIQRAGRLLRKDPSKPDVVSIFDIVVLPKDKFLELDKENNTRYSTRLFNIESKRIDFFNDLAKNNVDVKVQLQKWRNKYIWV